MPWVLYCVNVTVVQQVTLVHYWCVCMCVLDSIMCFCCAGQFKQRAGQSDTHHSLSLSLHQWAQIQSLRVMLPGSIRPCSRNDRRSMFVGPATPAVTGHTQTSSTGAGHTLSTTTRGKRRSDQSQHIIPSTMNYFSCPLCVLLLS